MNTPTPQQVADVKNRFNPKRLEELELQLRAARFVCAERERELLELKGPCSNSSKGCRLHLAHSGPCDQRPEEAGSPLWCNEHMEPYCPRHEGAI